MENRLNPNGMFVDVIHTNPNHSNNTYITGNKDYVYSNSSKDITLKQSIDAGTGTITLVAHSIFIGHDITLKASKIILNSKYELDCKGTLQCNDLQDYSKKCFIHKWEFTQLKGFHKNAK
ncbi:MAG: hypothetical protein Q8K60_05960 [Parachlamydiaceae bacterium]|nr:hypothetical protein [Parachlamydiaceae bacterium]